MIDVDRLLAPIVGENPSGENLLYQGLHDQIREARRADDGLEQGDWKREAKVSDWPRVQNLASDALASRTKDLQVCAWMVEALVRLHGFGGLRDGLRTVRGLMTQFWDTLFPEMDEGDLEARANAISFMDRATGLAIREVPITGNPVGVNYSYLQYEDARQFDVPENAENLSGQDLERVIAIRERAAIEKKPTSEQWRIAKNASRRAYYEAINQTLVECWDEYTKLDALMDEKFGRQTPGLAVLKKSLQEIRDLVERLLKEKRALEPDPVEAVEVSEPEEAQAPMGMPALSPGPIRSRQEALKRLAEVSEYFRQTEPHSPISYLVQRAIRWGQMPLDSWLEDVIKDTNVLAQLRETLGMKAPPP
jgi:type VI secretion system protein ImpA